MFTWLLPAAALPCVLLEGIWLLSGGVVVEGVCVLVALLWSAAEGEVVLWPVVVCVLLAPAAAPLVADPMLPAACWFVQVSEITFTELTCNEPSEP